MDSNETRRSLETIGAMMKALVREIEHLKTTIRDPLPSAEDAANPHDLTKEDVRALNRLAEAVNELLQAKIK